MSKRRNDDNDEDNYGYSDNEAPDNFHKRPATENDNGKPERKDKNPKFSNISLNDDKICVRFIIPSKFAGGLIGKKGSVINGLRDNYSVQVACPDSNGPERMFRVMGTEIDNIVDCVKDVAERLGPEMWNLNKRLDKENGTEMRLLVNKGIAGGVIGAKGSRIKELRENTGCLINMHSECCPSSTDRILQISGEIDNVVECLRTVIEHIETLESPSEQMKYDPNNWNDMIRYGGIKSDGSERGNPNDRKRINNQQTGPPMYGGGGGGSGHQPGPGHYPGMYGAPMYPGPQGAHGYPYPYPGAYGAPPPHHPYGGYPYPPPNAYAPYSPYAAAPPSQNNRNNGQDNRRDNRNDNRNERKSGFGHGRSNR